MEMLTVWKYNEAFTLGDCSYCFVMTTTAVIHNIYIQSCLICPMLGEGRAEWYSD